jgi:hypothetical protein
VKFKPERIAQSLIHRENVRHLVVELLLSSTNYYERFLEVARLPHRAMLHNAFGVEDLRRTIFDSQS